MALNFRNDLEEKNGGLQQFKQTVHAVHHRVESPIEISFSSALSAAAICTQALVDVRCPGGGVSPVSLNIIVSADSGERKTSTDKYFLEEISKFEQSQQNKNDEIKNGVDREVWIAKDKLLRSQLKKTACGGDEEKLAKLKTQVIEHAQCEPAQNIPFRILYENTTASAFLQNVAKGLKNVALASSEGGIIFERSLDFFPHLNKIWDGNEIRVDRSTCPSYIIRDARSCISIMCQKHFFERLLKRKNGIARHSGFLARCLVVEPDSTQGSRFQSNDSNLGQEYIDWFHRRQRILLEKAFEKHGRERVILKFSPEAERIWNEFYRFVEMELSENGFLSDIRDFASKIANNMSRIAAVLHCFCGGKGDIDAETATFAMEVSRLYIFEFKKLFGFRDPVNIAHENSTRLHSFLQKNCHAMGNRFLRSKLLQYGPNSCRKLADIKEALFLLESQGYVSITGPRGCDVSLTYLGMQTIPHYVPEPVNFSIEWHRVLSTFSPYVAAPHSQLQLLNSSNSRV